MNCPASINLSTEFGTTPGIGGVIKNFFTKIQIPEKTIHPYVKDSGVTPPPACPKTGILPEAGGRLNG